MTQVLELLWLVKRHVSGRRGVDYEGIKPIAVAIAAVAQFCNVGGGESPSQLSLSVVGLVGIKY